MIRQLITAGFYLRGTNKTFNWLYIRAATEWVFLECLKFSGLVFTFPSSLWTQLRLVRLRNRSVLFLSSSGNSRATRNSAPFVILTLQPSAVAFLKWGERLSAEMWRTRAHVCVTHYRRITANQTTDLCETRAINTSQSIGTARCDTVPPFPSVAATKNEQAMSRPLDSAFQTRMSRRSVSQSATCDLPG